MSEKDEKTRKHPQWDGYAGSPITQQMRTVGQRRRDAEIKLEHHLEEVRHDNAVKLEKPGAVNSHDVAAIQDDDRPIAADSGDFAANQGVVGNNDDGGNAVTRHTP